MIHWRAASSLLEAGVVVAVAELVVVVVAVVAGLVVALAAGAWAT